MVLVVQGQQPSLWVWLGPVLLFVGAMVTLYFTIRTTNKREWNKWRRDTLLAMCKDAAEMMRDIYTSADRAVIIESDRVAEDLLIQIDERARRLGFLMDQFRLVGADHLGAKCATSHTAGESLGDLIRAYRKARALNRQEQARNFEQADEKFEAPVANERERWEAYVKGPATEYNAARVRVDRGLHYFVREGFLELKSTSS